MDTTNVNFFLKQTLVSTVFDIETDHIKAVEKIVRNSMEYKKFIYDKRENLKQNSCPYLKDFDFTKGKATLELHHVIYLADLVECAYKLLIEQGKKFISTTEAASLVIQWHYEGIIPYIFLSKSMHELYHSGQYKFDMAYVSGNYKELFKRISMFQLQHSESMRKELNGC